MSKSAYECDRVTVNARECDSECEVSHRAAGECNFLTDTSYVFPGDFLVVEKSVGLLCLVVSSAQMFTRPHEQEEVQEVAEKAFQDVKLQRDQDRRATRQ